MSQLEPKARHRESQQDVSYVCSPFFSVFECSCATRSRKAPSAIEQSPIDAVDTLILSCGEWNLIVIIKSGVKLATRLQGPEFGPEKGTKTKCTHSGCTFCLTRFPALRRICGSQGNHEALLVLC